MGVNYSGRHRRRHDPAMTSIGSRTQVPQSRTGCAERRLAENMGAPHTHSTVHAATFQRVQHGAADWLHHNTTPVVTTGVTHGLVSYSVSKRSNSLLL
jgi:hypothetical protein